MSIDIRVLEALVEAGASGAQVLAAVKAMVQSDNDCVIYVAASADLTKVGISNDATRRLRELGRSAQKALRLVWVSNGPREIISAIEAATLLSLSEYRVTGEWFRVTPEEAIAVIKAEMAKRGFAS